VFRSAVCAILNADVRDIRSAFYAWPLPATSSD
jgi:hypothetical protein